MREVELVYVEVVNETEQLFVFRTIFNGQEYAQAVMINIVLPIGAQDFTLRKAISALANMTRKDAASAEMI